MELGFKGANMKRIIIIFSFLIFILISNVSYGQEWWQKWDNYPKVPKITAKEVKSMMLTGQKLIFVYSGPVKDELVCGSFYIPYTKVPPSSDGSSVNIQVPQNYWIMCY